MAFPDFNTKIDLRYTADKWGIFSVTLSDDSGITGIPSDETISDVTLKVFEGKVKPDVDITTLTDVSTDLIETGSVSFAGLSVFWEMNYPTEPTNFKGKKFTLIFEIETSGGRKYPFYLYYVKVV